MTTLRELKNFWTIVALTILLAGISACSDDDDVSTAISNDSISDAAQTEVSRSTDGDAINVDGTDGTDSVDSTDGNNGTDGADGTDTSNGEDGTDSTDATDGTDGTSTGNAGPTNLVVAVADSVYSKSGTYSLTSIVPGPLAELRVPVVISNSGDQPVALTEAGLTPFNQDDTPKSVWISIDYKGKSVKDILPMTLEPQSINPKSTLAFDVVYAPKSFDTNPATLRVTTEGQPVDIEFKPAQVSPKIRVEPEAFTFSEASLVNSEKKIFRIHNDGVVPLVFHKMAFAESTDVFKVIDGPKWGGKVQVPGHKDYKPLVFTVEYQPLFGSANDSMKLLLHTNDKENSPSNLPLSATYVTEVDTSPCLILYETADLGYVDFSDVVEKPQAHTITLKNAGKKVCKVNSITVANDPDGNYYSLKTLLPSNASDNPPELINNLPISYGSGKSILIEITYKPQSEGFDGNLVIEYEDPEAKSETVLLSGGGPKPIFEYGPGSKSTPVPLQLVSDSTNPDTPSLRKFWIFNAGTAVLSVNNMSIADKDAPDQGSNHWALSGFFNFPVKVKPNRVKAFELFMKDPENPGTSTGILTIEYKGSQGPGTLEVPLQKITDGTTKKTLPKANAGATNDYPNLVAGSPFTLKGSSLDNVSPADGYLWLVVEKPSDSTLVVDGVPGPDQKEVTPDTSGTYRFALIVRTQDALPLYSEPHEVQVNVAPAPEPEPKDDPQDDSK